MGRFERASQHRSQGQDESGNAMGLKLPEPALSPPILRRTNSGSLGHSEQIADDVPLLPHHGPEANQGNNNGFNMLSTSLQTGKIDRQIRRRDNILFGLSCICVGLSVFDMEWQWRVAGHGEALQSDVVSYLARGAIVLITLFSAAFIVEYHYFLMWSENESFVFNIKREQKRKFQRHQRELKRQHELEVEELGFDNSKGKEPEGNGGPSVRRRVNSYRRNSFDSDSLADETMQHLNPERVAELVEIAARLRYQAPTLASVFFNMKQEVMPELLLLLLMPLPGAQYFLPQWLDLLCSTCILLRLLTGLRVLRNYSHLYRIRNKIRQLKGYSQALSLKFNTWLTLKMLFYKHPIVLITGWIVYAGGVTGYGIYLFERRVQPELFGISEGIMISVVGMLTAWPGDPFDVYDPVTMGGRALAVVSCFLGVVLFALLVNLLNYRLRPNSVEESALEWSTFSGHMERLRDHSARIIQIAWRTYRFRMHGKYSYANQKRRKVIRKALKAELQQQINVVRGVRRKMASLPRAAAIESASRVHNYALGNRFESTGKTVLTPGPTSPTSPTGTEPGIPDKGKTPSRASLFGLGQARMIKRPDEQAPSNDDFPLNPTGRRDGYSVQIHEEIIHEEDSTSSECDGRKNPFEAFVTSAYDVQVDSESSYYDDFAAAPVHTTNPLNPTITGPRGQLPFDPGLNRSVFGMPSPAMHPFGVAGINGPGTSSIDEQVQSTPYMQMLIEGAVERAVAATEMKLLQAIQQDRLRGQQALVNEIGYTVEQAVEHAVEHVQDAASKSTNSDNDVEV
eukprot:Clim_evm28s44 gene=Clim_evmTU28s44